MLIDSEIISAGVLADGLADLGLPVDRDYVLRHFLGRTYPAMVAAVEARLNYKLGEDFEQQHARRLLAAFQRDLTVMPGVLDVLDRLAVPFCLATSSSPNRVFGSLRVVGLTDRFAGRVFTAAAVPAGKPAPDLFLHVAAEMAVDPADCLVIEDSVPGLQAAIAAGMITWHFTGGSHAAATAANLPAGVTPHRTFDSFAKFFEAAPDLRMPVSAKP